MATHSRGMTPSHDPHRRRLLAAAASAFALAACQPLRPRANATQPLVLTLTGQALIAHDLCTHRYPGLDAVVAEIQRGDLAITDLETAIVTAASGPPTRAGTFMHAAGLAELSCVKQLGFGMLALANNHAGDFGREGVLATRDAVLAQGIQPAGTGANLAAASAAAVIEVRGTRVALVAAAAGKVRDGAAATATLPGVNELRLGADGTPLAEDQARMLAAIRAATVDNDHVVAYLHNHDWREDMQITQSWARAFARACVDAGAGVFFSHGAPLLHGIERYRGALLCHGLGSLIFHSRTDEGHYPAAVWESAIVHLHWQGKTLSRVEVVPVLLNERGDDPGQHEQTRGRPRIAEGADAERILQRLQQLSANFGTSLQIHGARGSISLN